METSPPRYLKEVGLALGQQGACQPVPEPTPPILSYQPGALQGAPSGSGAVAFIKAECPKINNWPTDLHLSLPELTDVSQLWGNSQQSGLGGGRRLNLLLTGLLCE